MEGGERNNTSNHERPTLSSSSLRAAVLNHSIFDPSDPLVKHDILQAIIQYLQDEGYTSSSMVVQDETDVKMKTISSKRTHLKRMKKAILDGEWSEVDRLLSRSTFKNIKPLRYAVYRQQFLELIDEHAPAQAFTLLTHRLKELEAYAHTADEFRDMCYLLTCKSVAHAPAFRQWEGVAASRASLVEQYSRLMQIDTYQRDIHMPVSGEEHLEKRQVPPSRLVHLLQQALAFQIASCRHVAEPLPRIGTILEDYEAVVVPNRRMHRFVGHAANVKCVAFVGEEGCTLASGSSDNTVRLWDTNSSRCKALLRGHRSRIWNVSATANGTLLASGSGDGTIRLWDTAPILDANTNGRWRSDGQTQLSPDASVEDVEVIDECKTKLSGHENDVYTVRFHPLGNALVSGGYDRVVRLYDTATGDILKTFTGHRSWISSISFNARGNMIITGSKDSTIKFWDIISGMCIKTISSHLGEVTSVETNQSGTLMLSSSKDNSNRLWDLRMNRAIRRFKGHQNTSKNFIRTAFGPRESVVVGGSEDGFVYVWDVETEDVVSKLGPTQGPVYDVKWNSRQSVVASCADDGIVSSWCYKSDVDKSSGN